MRRKLLMTPEEIKNSLERIAFEIKEREGLKKLCIIGIRNRGDILGKRIKEIFRKETKVSIPVGVIDITLYRDDFTTLGPKPLIGSSEIPCKIEGKTIILVDDVLYTGRTTRAALDEIIDFGRPEKISLCILVDRGGREFPICPDYIGRKVEVGDNDIVEVHLEEIDKDEGVFIVKRGGKD